MKMHVLFPSQIRMNVTYHSSLVLITVITLLAALDVLVLQDIFFKGMAKPVKVIIHKSYFLPFTAFTRCPGGGGNLVT